ncbi:type III-A CRISPR-associated CARF protein Csm6 [Pectinatus brassicae]|uniref:type III-A CRISPR-associated CARF protein Csm6 n=1 Tax=Pectinatus brassicae TaxID=862415 RepID=UPI0018C52D97
MKLYHEDIDKPQVMDKFDKYYPEDLRKIYEENPDCTVLANVTSGTAQMMHEITIFCGDGGFPYKVKTIAVDTPAKKSNHSIAVNDEYDKEASWANNIDNITDSSEIEVRCKEEIKHDNIKKGLVKNIIIKYLETYDLKGALTVLQTAEYFFAPDLAKILRAADYRLHLEHSKAQKYFDSSSLKYKEVYPVQSSDCRDIFEYILHLKKLGARNNLLEFAQGISPVLYRLSYMLLKKSLNIPMDDYTFQDRGVRKYEERKTNLPDIYKKEFINMNYKTPINTSNLLPHYRL